jgi:hypothetical protein
MALPKLLIFCAILVVNSQLYYQSTEGIHLKLEL